MSTLGILFIILFSAILFTPFILMYVKGYYHFEYLKMLDPKKYLNNDNFISVSKTSFYDKYFWLIFPSFKRKKEKEASKELVKLGKKVELLCKLTYYAFAFVVIFVIVLIVLFGDFS